MTDSPAPIRWSPRVEPRKIRRLYAGDAQGLLDEELLDDVFLTIYLRCKSIIEATDASRGRITCQGCGKILVMPEGFRKGRNRRSEFPVRCDACGWNTTWGAFFRSYQKKQLSAGGAEPFFREFVANVATPRTSRDKLLMIDKLIHQFHTLWGEIGTRPAAVNVIGGTCGEVGALIEELANGDVTRPQMLENQRQWQEQWEKARGMWVRPDRPG